MRIATIALSAVLAVAAASTGWAQGVPGRAVMGHSGEAGLLQPYHHVDPVFGTSSDPAGVMDGTNPNPDPYHAGGILSSDAAVHGWGR